MAFGARVYDAQNRLLLNVAPKKMSLSSNSESNLRFDVLLDKVPKGTYRIDVRWNEDTAWRTFVTIID
jgi:hypothetical protein